ncbi:MAG: hypothetical protein AAF680_00250 [Pseudomonadota bacterium]
MVRAAERIASLARVHADVDFSDPRAKDVANSAADEIRGLILELVSNEDWDDLSLLLEDCVTASWAAYTAMESDGVPNRVAEASLKTIRSLADGPGAESLGARTWLQERGHDT